MRRHGRLQEGARSVAQCLDEAFVCHRLSVDIKIRLLGLGLLLQFLGLYLLLLTDGKKVREPSLSS